MNKNAIKWFWVKFSAIAAKNCEFWITNSRKKKVKRSKIKNKENFQVTLTYWTVLFEILGTTSILYSLLRWELLLTVISNVQC